MRQFVVRAPARLGAGRIWVRTLLGGALLSLCFGACQNRGVPQSHPRDVRALVGASGEPFTPEFRPLSAGERAQFTLPAPQPYRLGVGDVVHVAVPGNEDYAGFGETSTGDVVGTRVKEDGNLYLPIIQSVPALGRTALQLQEDIRQRLDAAAQEGVFVTVDVIHHNSQRFYAFGRVNSPGAYPVNGRTRLIDGLSLAGGVDAESGDAEEAYVVRDGHVLPVSVADVLYRAHPVGQLTLQHGDLIFVPFRSELTERVYVLGEVSTPGVVEMRHKRDALGKLQQGRLSLADAIASAGGLRAETADYNTIRIFRGSWQGLRAYGISAREVYRHGESILLQPGDRVLIAPTDSAEFNRMLRSMMPLLTGAGTALGLAATAAALSR